jgi:hypothetical protein
MKLVYFHRDSVHNMVSQTFCPSSFNRDIRADIEDESLIITVSSPNSQKLRFSFWIEVEEEFDLHLNTTRNVSIAPFQSRFFSFEFPKNVKEIILEAHSTDDICMTLSLRERKVFLYYFAAD